MKSFWIVTAGRESVCELREVPVPEPQAKEVLVRVHASALNRGELIVGGAVHGGPERLGGSECAGVVCAVGADVDRWSPGDRVFGRVRGAFAEYALAHPNQLMPLPERLTWEQAAAIPSTFLTAYEAMIQHGALKPGEWVLVTGASAGTGVACLLIAQVIGARTIGTSRSRDKLERLRALGLDVAIETPAPLASQVLQATEGRGADLGVNLVGASAVPEMLAALGQGGRLAIVGYVDGTYRAEVDFEQVHIRRHHIFGISNARLSIEARCETTRGFARDILPAIAEGRITPVVDRVFPLDELPAARAHMDAPGRVGKVVVRVAE